MGRNSKEFVYSPGFGVGGTSTKSYEVYHRGSKDQWDDIGVPGWDWESMLKV